MRPLSPCVLLVMLFCASAQAGFVIKLDSKELAPNTPDQAVDIFLEFHADPASLPSGYVPAVQSITIGAHLGGSAAKFQKSIDDAYRDGISMDHSGSFWQSADTSDTLPVTGYTTAQATFRASPSSAYRELPLQDSQSGTFEAKIGSFHIDTTGVSTGSLQLSLGTVQQNTSITVESLSGGTTTWIPLSLPNTTSDADPNRLTFEPVTFNIASTPEPSVIGFAGLGLAAGVGWLRARRRKSAR